MWIGVCLSVVVELVPEKLRITGIGVYFFIITNIGGNMQILLPIVRRLLVSWFGLTDIEAFKGALYIFYPGEYILGSAMFLFTLFVLKRDINRLKEVSAKEDVQHVAKLNNNGPISLAELEKKQEVNF